MAKPADFSGKSIEELGLSPEVEGALRDVIATLGADYRESFVTMVQAINRQASALDRIQATLNVLIANVAPELNNLIPAAVSVAPPGARPDLASAMIVADPIGAGYVLSQEALAKAIRVSATDVSILVKALRLRDDGSCAVCVRRGPSSRSAIVNYHPRAIARLRELIASASTSGWDSGQVSALRRARKALAMSPTAGSSKE